MSPQIALHDPVFRAYFWTVLLSLAIAGAVLGYLRFVLKKETASMFKTYWSWILIAGIGFIVVFLGRIPNNRRHHVARDLRFQGIRERIGFVS